MEKHTVEMTAEEQKKYEAYKAEESKKNKIIKRKEDRQAYSELVDEMIKTAMPTLCAVSDEIAKAKTMVVDNFKQVIELKGELFGVKKAQRTHTFTNSDSSSRITLGYHCLDNYKDTVSDGVAMVKEYIESLAKDKETQSLVSAVLRLLSKDQAGNLKASRVLQLRRMAEDSGNERFIEGVEIIEESYLPTLSKQFIRAEIKNELNAWVNIPLGMTES